MIYGKQKIDDDIIDESKSDANKKKKKCKEKKGKKIKCVLCSKTFTSCHTLNMHYEMTHTTKKFACDQWD